jgi:ribonuclease HI
MASLYLTYLNRLKTKALKNQTWDGVVKINQSMLQDLLWWKEVLRKNIPNSLLVPEYQGTMWTDASATGWGVHAVWKDDVEGEQERLAHGHWENSWSSNRRELAAVQRALQSLSGKEMEYIRHWLLRSDNSTVVYNLNRIASAPSLIQPMRKLMNWLDAKGMTIRAVHVKGVENTKADSLSRLNRAGDYQLIQTILNKALCTLDITISCDLFASRSNKKHQNYCSLSLMDSSSLSRDAFLLEWSHMGIPLVHPPIPLLLKCLRKIFHEKAQAVVIAPLWAGQVWSPMLHSMTQRMTVLGSSQLCLRPGFKMRKCQDHLPPGMMAAYLVNGSMIKE